MVCHPLQHHQYVLQASVLKESWPVAESAWGLVEVEPEKEECEEGHLQRCILY